MPAATVRVPGLLTRFTDGDSRVGVEAETVEGTLAKLVSAVPALEPHLFDGRGGLRPHLRVFHIGEAVELDGTGDLADNDTVAIVQAVSGGSGAPVPQRARHVGSARTSETKKRGTAKTAEYQAEPTINSTHVEAP